ncbi:MAG: hypothetical protein ACKPBU_10230, partial [Alphaproteobacteria bacterium]
MPGERRPSAPGGRRPRVPARGRPGGGPRAGHDGAGTGFGGPRRDPSRVACAHFPDCVGCPLVGTTYGEQLRSKEETLRAEL